MVDVKPTGRVGLQKKAPATVLAVALRRIFLTLLHRVLFSPGKRRDDNRLPSAAKLRLGRAMVSLTERGRWQLARPRGQTQSARPVFHQQDFRPR